MSFYQQDIKEVFERFQSSPEGISSHEVEKRLLHYGKNNLSVEKNISLLRLFFHQFNDPLVLVLVVAAIVSLLLQHITDAIVIFVILLFNAGFGFFQEYKAEEAIFLLRKLREYKSRVFRQGKDLLVDSTTLVPGDILLLQEGDKIPADARLFSVYSLSVDESSLTGESRPVQKTSSSLSSKNLVLGDQKNMVFSGTLVVRGEGRAIIVATGMQTELGKIAGELVNIEDTPTPLQKKLKEIGRVITLTVLLICLIVFFLGLFEGVSASEMFLTAVTLAVAAIPEGLPAVVTITLALGLGRMLKKKALIRQLKSVETLGSVTVICSDKTGTLTKNEMTVTKVYSSFQQYTVTGLGYSLKGDILFQGKKAERDIQSLLLVSATCSTATVDLGDPTERALQVLAAKGNVSPVKKVSAIPFSSDRKFMSVTDKDGVHYVKGALEVILAQCLYIEEQGKKRKITPLDRKKILQVQDEYSCEALRVLAFAYGKKDLAFVGLVGMIDPPRLGVKKAIALCHTAGIRSLMITGDYELTAKAVAAQVGIQGESLSGSVLEKLSDTDLRTLVRHVSIYARVTSQHKERILRALQANGEIVAMTGDGVNDALALKQADVGVAMNIKGTDVSKDIADLILLDDNFVSIVEAVNEGRTIYANIQKFVKYLLAANFGEVGSIFIFLLLGFPLPLLPVQLLWLNLITDGFPAVALGIDSAEQGQMQKKPRDSHEGFFSHMSSFLFFSTLFSVLLALGLFFYYSPFTDIATLRTIILTSLILFELFLVFVCRSKDTPFFSLTPNWYLFGAVFLSFLFHLLLLYTSLGEYFSLVPLSLRDWVLIVPLALLGPLLFELWKAVKKHIS